MVERGARPLDGAWLRANPLPMPEPGADKNERGRVLVLGGCLTVPGGVRLTAEAALRAGAGKVRIGTVEPAALTLGLLFPEVAVIPLPTSTSGEIAATHEMLAPHTQKSDAVVAGPAMSCPDHGARLVQAILEAEGEDTDGALVIDAAALLSLASHRDALSRRKGWALLTPHIGEMAAMMECDADEIDRDRAGSAKAAADQFHSVVVLKGQSTLIATPDGAMFHYGGGGVGLATGGSGDVLAGIAGALLARGCTPLDAALWAVWLHGESGRRCSHSIGPMGFLASDLLPLIPAVMAERSDEPAEDRR